MKNELQTHKQTSASQKNNVIIQHSQENRSYLHAISFELCCFKVKIGLKKKERKERRKEKKGEKTKGCSGNILHLQSYPIYECVLHVTSCIYGFKKRKEIKN